MSKVITSPSKRWTGTVTISDPLLLPQVEAIESAMEIRPEGDKVYITVIDKPRLPAIFACVEKWELQNFAISVTPTIEEFPMSPRVESHKLIDWLWSEIRNVYLGESQVPNE